MVGSTTVGTEITQDIDLHRVLDRIKKQMQEKQKETTRLQKRLASKDFTEKAEPNVIQESESRLQALTQEITLLESSQHQLSSILG